MSTIIIDAEAAKLAGLQIDTLQKVRVGQITLDQWGWFNNLTREERERLATSDIRFTILTTFNLTVPKGYNHATQLRAFKANANRSHFFYYNSAVTDTHFKGATTKLVSGQKFKVKIFQIGQSVTSTDCLGFLRRQKAILVGAQGLSLVWQQAKEKFPVNRWIASFDEKDALWVDDIVGCHCVPCLCRRLDGAWEFHLGSFEINWPGHCLLCFCDCDKNV